MRKPPMAAPPAPAPRVVHELVVRTPAPLVDIVSAWLFELGAAGIEEREDDHGIALVMCGDEPAPLEELARMLGARLSALELADELSDRVEVSLRAVEGVDWETEWMRHLGPVLIGDGVVLKPVWDTTPAPGDRRAILFEPRMAFGDGSHPTTLLAAESVERFCRARPAARVLDVGTGNGVLGLVALACGAELVRAIDVDPACVSATRVNAELNGVADRLEVSTDALEVIHSDYDLVVANMELNGLLALVPGLVSRVAPRGRLSVTGLLAGQESPLTRALGRRGFGVIHDERHRDFVLLECERTSS